MYMGDRWNFRGPGRVRGACCRACGGLSRRHAERLKVVGFALIMRHALDVNGLRAGQQAHGLGLAHLTQARMLSPARLSTMCHAHSAQIPF